MSKAKVEEVNFDGLVGPTHQFGGLSFGNLASSTNKGRPSNPKAAALQGLRKMQALRKRGFVQAILPPHPRPHVPTLKRLGFSGSEDKIIKSAFEHLPELFARLSSSSAMWAANAGTFCPSIDAQDEKAHITPANLVSMLHRSIEGDFHYQVFKRIFKDENKFVVHQALPPFGLFSDEGAANHNRLCPTHAEKGLQIFVFSKDDQNVSKTNVFPARQAKLANLALARLHGLHDEHFINLEQNPLAIDNGAFHNDVVAVANESVFLCHEYAFSNQKIILDQLSSYYEELYDEELHLIEIPNKLLPIKEAVKSYLFNSQILSKKDGSMLLFAPSECQENPYAANAIELIISDKNPINEVVFFNVRESMANGGGPACLRLRAVLNDAELKAIHQGVILDEEKEEALFAIVEKYYKEDFVIKDLLDAKFRQNCAYALDEISRIIKLDNLYNN